MEEKNVIFRAFIRFLMDSIKEASDEKDGRKKDEKLKEILESLQDILDE